MSFIEITKIGRKGTMAATCLAISSHSFFCQCPSYTFPEPAVLKLRRSDLLRRRYLAVRLGIVCTRWHGHLLEMLTRPGADDVVIDRIIIFHPGYRILPWSWQYEGHRSSFLKMSSSSGMPESGFSCPGQPAARGSLGELFQASPRR